MVVSDKVYKQMELDYKDEIIKACSCSKNVHLWHELLIGEDEPIASIGKCHVMDSIWCVNCGQETINTILN